MGTVGYVVSGKKTDVFGIRKGQVVVAKTAVKLPMGSPARNLEARSVLGGARSARTCRVVTCDSRWQVRQGLGLLQRAGAQQRLHQPGCRLRSS